MSRLLFGLHNIGPQIDSFAARLPVNKSKRAEISNQAKKFARLYLENLGEREDRFPISVVLSALFISSQEAGIGVSQDKIQLLARCMAPNWTTVAEDMTKLLRGDSVKFSVANKLISPRGETRRFI